MNKNRDKKTDKEYRQILIGLGRKPTRTQVKQYKKLDQSLEVAKVEK